MTDINEIAIKEKEEMELIERGGLYPHPWAIKKNKDGSCDINAADAALVGTVEDEDVARWIRDKFNSAPVAFLTDSIYYY